MMRVVSVRSRRDRMQADLRDHLGKTVRIVPAGPDVIGRLQRAQPATRIDRRLCAGDEN